MLDSLLSKLTNRQRQRQQTDAESYRQLVDDVAGGKQPKIDAIEATLQAAGKTAEDLAGDVQLIQRRRQWREVLDGEAELKQERSELLARKETAKAELQQLRTDHERSMEAVNQQLARVDADLRDCDEARRLLATTAAADVQTAQRRLPGKAAFESRQKAERELRNAKSRLEGLQREKNTNRSDLLPANIDHRIRVAEQTVAEAEERAASARERHAEIQAEGERLTAESLTVA